VPAAGGLHDARVPVLIIVLVLALIALMWWLGARFERQRREAFQAWAAARGLRYSREGPGGAPNSVGGYELLERGGHHDCTNLVTGAGPSGAITVFDWRYTTGSGKSRKIHHRTAVHLRPSCRLGGLRIREEGLFDRLAELVGFNDIDFESAEFSRAFHVSAEDRRWAYDVITAENMENLLRLPRFCLEMRGNGILLWRENGRLSPADCDAALGLAEALLAGIQPAVRRQLGLAT